VLSGDTSQLSTAGEAALDQLLAEPTVETFMRASRQFATEAGLLVADVETAIESVADVGGQAAMAMLGRTVFSVGTGLSEAGYDPAVCGVDAAGGRIVETRGRLTPKSERFDAGVEHAYNE